MIFKRSLAYSAGALAARGINLCTLSLILATVGPKGYGAFQFHQSLLSIAMGFGLLGTNALLFREFSHGLRHACNWLYHGILVRFAGISLAIAAVTIFALLGGAQIDPWIFSGCVFLATGETTILLNSSWLKARRLPIADFVVTVSRCLLVFAAVALVLRRLPNGRGIALGYLIGVGIVLTSIAWEWRRPLRIGRAQPFSFREMILPGGTLLLLEAMGSCISEIPVVSLGHDGNFSEVGLFSTCYKFLTAASFISVGYDQSFQPDFTRAARRGDPKLRALLRHGVIFTAGLGLLSGIGVLLAGPLVLKYAAHLSVDPRLIYTFACFPLVSGVAAMMDNCLIGIGKERLLVLSHGSGLATLIACIFAMAPGSAWTASLSFVIGFFVKALIASLLLLQNLKHVPEK